VGATGLVLKKWETPAFHILERQNQNWHDDWLAPGNILRKLEGNRAGLAAWCFDSQIL